MTDTGHTTMPRSRISAIAGLCLALAGGCYTGAEVFVDAGGEPGGSEESGVEYEFVGGSSESSGGEVPAARALEAGNLPPDIADPGPQVIEEDEVLELVVEVRDPDDDPLRVWAQGLPPGATWDEDARALRFRPDFIQGGGEWTLTIVADDGEHRTRRDVAIAVIDSIRPPEPEIVDTEFYDSFTRLTLLQVTDDYTDSPGNAGRSFVAFVTVPVSATPDEPAPVRISLHGIGASAPSAGASNEFRVGPHDPDNTYWWGYDAALPDGEASGDDVPDYTQRRVLQLLGWVLENHPEADPTRVYVSGGSMGGAGAMTLGLWYARHFAYLSGSWGQAVPRNHRPSRLTQLQGLWGPSDGPHWDLLDLTRLLRDSPEARDQYVFTRHGKDDPTIHFGAAVLPSPLTGYRWYDALQDLGVGHLAVWDEGAHGPADPLLGSGWWDDGFSPIHDDLTFVRRDLAFPAFSLSSNDGDPGDGQGNGKQTWSANRGFAGTLEVVGDTGWNGEIAGALNRFLRWDAAAIVDELDRFAVPLHVLDGEGSGPPKAGYPTRGDRFDGELPVVVDVTPRRLQGFRVRPGERIAWQFGAQHGEVVVDERGTLTIPGLELGLAWQTLELTRAP